MMTIQLITLTWHDYCSATQKYFVRPDRSLSLRLNRFRQYKNRAWEYGLVHTVKLLTTAIKPENWLLNPLHVNTRIGNGTALRFGNGSHSKDFLELSRQHRKCSAYPVLSTRSFVFNVITQFLTKQILWTQFTFLTNQNTRVSSCRYIIQNFLIFLTNLTISHCRKSILLESIPSVESDRHRHIACSATVTKKIHNLPFGRILPDVQIHDPL